MLPPIDLNVVSTTTRTNNENVEPVPAELLLRRVA
jgi:hypothetical protein